MMLTWKHLRPKCTKFDFRWNRATDPTGEAYRPLARVGVLAYKGRDGREREGEGEGRGREGEEGSIPRKGILATALAEL